MSIDKRANEVKPSNIRNVSGNMLIFLTHSLYRPNGFMPYNHDYAFRLIEIIINNGLDSSQ